MGLGLKRAGYSGNVVGVSRPETIEQALELGVIDAGWSYDEMELALSGADLIFICTPIQRILRLFEEVGRFAGPGTLVTDVGSTKRSIMAKAASCLRRDLYFIGGHPMAGSEKAGVSAADPFLFQNAIYILTAASNVPREHFSAFVELLEQVGARVLELSADTHDQVVAAISHLPQIMATSLVEMVGEMNEEDGFFLPLAAGGFRDLTRIASSSYAPMWRDICRTNADQIRAMIDRYISVLKDVRVRIEEESLQRDFSYARKIRAKIPRDAKGFIHTLFEILVVAEDRQGVIAEISAALAGERININDIEVMKVREGEGGTIRLGFDSEEACERAMGILSGLGYQARRPWVKE